MKYLMRLCIGIAIAFLMLPFLYEYTWDKDLVFYMLSFQAGVCAFIFWFAQFMEDALEKKIGE